MENEKLVLNIQNGKTEYIPELWENISAFVEWKAKKYLAEYPPHYQDLKEDMINEGYFAMLEAAKGYDADKGAFTTYLAWHLKNCFRSVIFSGKGQKKENDPLNRALSLDLPIEGAEDLTLADMLIDENAEAYYRRIEDIDFWNNVRKFLKEAIKHIKDEKGRNIINYMYKHGSTIKEAAETLYTGQGRLDERYHNGIREIKRYMGRSAVKKQMQLMGLDDYICGWGLRSWKYNNFTSSTEYIAIRRADKAMKYKDIENILL